MRTMTVSAAIEEWSVGRSEVDRRRAIRFLELVGDRNVATITPQHVVRFRNARLTDVGATTVQREMAVVSSVFRFCVEQQAISSNPCRDVRRPPGRSRSPSVLSLVGQSAVIDATINHPLLGPFYMTAFYTALRREEITRLRWSHVDFGRQWSERSEASGVILSPGTKTDRASDPIPLMPELARYLRTLPRRGDFIVHGPNGEPVKPNAINKAIHRWNEAFARGEKPFRVPNPHQCRHTCLTLLIAAQTNIVAVSRFGRHADVRVTSRIYDQSRAMDFANVISRGFESR